MRNVWFIHVLFLFVLIPSLLCADSIVVHNNTDVDLFFAVYYVYGGANRATDVAKISKGQRAILGRPDRKLKKSFSYYDRQLAFAKKQETLLPVFDKDSFKSVPQTNVGDKHGNAFYISQHEGRLKGYDAVQWQIVQPAWQAFKSGEEKVIAVVTDPIKDQIKKSQPAIVNNPYKKTVAKLRIGNGLHPQEQAYLKAREPKVKKALEVFLGESLDGKYVPKIAFIGSGGGYRAMTCTMGFCVGAQKIGLLDSLTYLVGLSGSTWALGLWQASGQKDVGKFWDSLKTKMKRGLTQISFKELEMITNGILVKKAFDQPTTLVDLYGAALTNAVLSDLGDERQRVYLSQQVKNLQNGNWVFPIYTAITGEDRKGGMPEWYEFTPLEVGGAWLGVYTPTWAYGRKFEKGTSTDFAPEQTLGFNLGTFGSAFAATVDQIFGDVSSKIPNELVRSVLEKMLKPIGGDRLTWAEVHNYSYLVPGTPMSLAKNLRKVDAGLAFNLPYPPVSGERPERAPDVLIFLDASKTIKNAPAFMGAEKYARRKNLKYPPIDYTGLESRAISIFKDQKNPNAPVVIYMPRIKDNELWNKKKNDPAFQQYARYLEGFDAEACVHKSYCNTNNFYYDVEQATQLSSLTAFNMQASKDKIAEAIRWKINQRSSSK